MQRFFAEAHPEELGKYGVTKRNAKTDELEFVNGVIFNTMHQAEEYARQRNEEYKIENIGSHK